MARAARGKGPLGKRLSRDDPGGGLPDLFSKIELLAQSYAVDDFVADVLRRAVAAGDTPEEVPPEFRNRYFWLSIRLAGEYVEGCRLESPKGRGGRPKGWTRWRLVMLAHDVEWLRKHEAAKGRRLLDTDACDWWAGKGSWAGYTKGALLKKLPQARREAAKQP